MVPAMSSVVASSVTTAMRLRTGHRAEAVSSKTRTQHRDAVKQSGHSRNQPVTECAFFIKVVASIEHSQHNR